MNIIIYIYWNILELNIFEREHGTETWTGTLNGNMEQEHGMEHGTGTWNGNLEDGRGIL